MFEIWCFTTVLQIFWSISIFFLLVRKIYFLTHLSEVVALCRNQPIKLNCLSMALFLYNGNTGLKWIKENLTGFLQITPTWKPYLVSGKCFHSPATQAWKFSWCFYSVLMGRFPSYISKVKLAPTTYKMELLVKMVIGFQPLTNVTMNYILDVAGSSIFYCHNIPMNQTLKQWMGQKTSFLWASYKIHWVLFLPNLFQPSFAILVNFKSNPWTGFYIITWTSS